jgi:hypothetical protein
LAFRSGSVVRNAANFRILGREQQSRDDDDKCSSSSVALQIPADVAADAPPGMRHDWVLARSRRIER